MSELVDPAALRERQHSEEPPTVVDVRSPEEYAQEHLPGAVNIPAGELPSRLGEVPSDRPVVPY
ncbi:MAG: rhodanese-like domain-containing protein [Chloroflexota bacterium]|nr:rhodanese-like domain-containing protein [Chloroflexota bacterium]